MARWVGDPSSHEEVERRPIFLPYGPLWPVLERILPLTLSILQRGTLIFITDLRIYAWWITFFYHLFHSMSVSLLYSQFLYDIAQSLLYFHKSQKYTFLLLIHHNSRGILLSAVRRCVCSRYLKKEEAMAHVRSQPYRGKTPYIH